MMVRSEAVQTGMVLGASRPVSGMETMEGLVPASVMGGFRRRARQYVEESDRVQRS